MRKDKFKKPNTMVPVNLVELPPEILLHCFNFINSPKDLVNISRTNHTLHEIAIDPCLWQKFNLKEQITNIDINFFPTRKHINALIVLTIGYLVSCDTKYLYLWDYDTFKLLTKKRANSKISKLCALPDGKFVSGHEDATIKFWSVNINKFDKLYFSKLKTISKNSCSCSTKPKCSGIKFLAVMPQGYLVRGGCNSGNFQIWKINNIIYINYYGSYPVGTDVNCMAILADGKFVINTNCFRKRFYIWNPVVGNYHGYHSYLPTLASNTWPLGTVIDIAPLPDGKFASVTSENQNIIRIWDLTSGDCKKELYAQTVVTGLGVLQNDLLYSTSLNKVNNGKTCVGRVSFWNIKKGQCINQNKFDAKYRFKNGLSVSFADLKDGRLVCGSSRIGFFVYKLHFYSKPENRLEQLASQQKSKLN